MVLRRPRRHPPPRRHPQPRRRPPPQPRPQPPARRTWSKTWRISAGSVYRRVEPQLRFIQHRQRRDLIDDRQEQRGSCLHGNRRAVDRLQRPVVRHCAGLCGDGVLTATVETYSAVQVAQKAQYSVSNLANAAHTLTIVATGTMDSNSAGAWVWVNAFNVTTASDGCARARSRYHDYIDAAIGDGWRIVFRDPGGKRRRCAVHVDAHGRGDAGGAFACQRGDHRIAPPLPAFRLSRSRLPTAPRRRPARVFR